ncbi:hypothetical protein [Oerskovia sp. KBS0722]|uniref:hypothetical protein n=1 Tax=Oerskovia sp. KBS0722 TaxID=1179673 RepID=UPI001FEE0F5F|nr:hypothetical protein [Oerskovia sp. KBS0722]
MSQTTTVLVELADDPGAVERPLAADDPGSALPPLPARTGWRRWAWVVPTVPAVVLVAYRQLAPSQGWPLPAAVLGVLAVLLLLVAVLALARYLDDRDAQRESRARDALLADAERTTGSVLVDSTAVSGEAAALRVLPDGAARVSGRLTFSVDHLPVRSPFTVTVPAGTDGPRSGDPVAVWYPRSTDGRPRVVLVRYQRAWADDLLGAMHPERTGGGTSAPEAATADPSPAGEATPPSAPTNQDFLDALGRSGAEHPRLDTEQVPPTGAWRSVRVDLSLPGSTRSVLVFEDDHELVYIGPDGGAPQPLDPTDPSAALDLAERLLRGD